jgi:hypothetical protein
MQLFSVFPQCKYKGNVVHYGIIFITVPFFFKADFSYITCIIIMKLIRLPLLSFLFIFLTAFQSDRIDNIAGFIRQGNTPEIIKLCASTVEMTAMGQEDTYSKRQVEEELNKFFSKNKPQHVQLLHKVNSNQKFLFGVVILKSTGGTYRIAYTLNETEGAMKIIELRIEAEKTK